jgi:hypothetical protein
LTGLRTVARLGKQRALQGKGPAGGKDLIGRSLMTGWGKLI